MAALAPRRSLKSRAIQLLAQREHSRIELQRKLMAHARAEAHEARHALARPAGRDTGIADDAQAAARVGEVLDQLQAEGHLSAQRFVESRVNARQARFGNLRIRQELARHALTLPAEARQALNDSEVARACDVLARKYSTPAQDAADRARRARFLTGRGFSPDAVRQALRRSATDADAPYDSGD